MMVSVDPEDQAGTRLPPPPRPGQKGGAVVVGTVMGVLGLIGVPICLVAAVLTANPCGTFADSCADYGETSSIAVVFLYGAVLSAGLAAAGFVLMTVGLVSRRRQRSSLS